MSKSPEKARLYIEDDLAHGLSISPSKDQIHYLMTVMRGEAGDHVLLFNGRDGEWRAAINPTGKKTCVLAVEAITRPQSASPDAWLLFAPVKKARLDFIAQKASEMGASRIWPVQTDYCQVSRVNDNRLAANAIEAAEQTERLDIAHIMDFTPLSMALDALDAEDDGRLLIWCDEDSAGMPALNAIDAMKAHPKPQKVAILIGPEGGFSETERLRLSALQNCLKVSLGPRILRADTAVIAALACYQSVWGDWPS